MKRIGLAANGLAVAIAAAVIVYHFAKGLELDYVPFLLVLLVGLVHGLVLLTVVNRQAVVAASDRYTRQLFSSCELLMSGSGPEKKAAPAKRKSG
jgi:hypothetical protein